MAVQNRNPTCANPICAIPRRHTADCGSPDHCRGCLPAQAQDGSYLCGLCTRRLGEDAQQAAQLHEDLQYVIIRAGAGGEFTTGTSAGAPVPDDGVVAARDRIRTTLTILAQRISEQRGVRLPWHWKIVHLPRGVEGPANCVRVDDTRLSAIAAFVARHGEWLAARAGAGRFAAHLHSISRDPDLWRMAYPSGSDRKYVGDCPLIVTWTDGVDRPCGTRVYAIAGQPEVTCVGCTTRDTIEQWRRWIVGEPGSGKLADAYEIAARLSVQWMRPVDPALLRVWAHRGHIRPDMVEVPGSDPPATQPRRDARGRTLYPLDAVLEHARSAWGEAPALRRAS